MLRPTRLLALIFGLLPVIAGANSDLIQVTAVRSWSFPEVTRIILETTGPFEFKADRAQNPERLFFDILNARPLINQKRLFTHEVGDSLVQRIRVAETAPGTTRIVFDLAAPAKFNVTRLDTPDRMVIELRSLNAPPRISRVFAYPSLPPVRQLQIQILQPPPQLALALPELPLAFLTDLFPKPADPAPLVTTSVTTSVITSVSTSVSSTRVLSASPRLPLTQSTALAGENASRSLTRALGLKVNRIVIDAGHGGHDDGTIGPHGIVEKDVVLDVALRLSKLIQDRMGVEVVLTRSDDNFVPLQERTAIANTHKADLFLSIHANSSPAPEVAGTETFFLNFTTSPGALDVAARENAGADKNVGELKDLIQSITLNDKIEESQTFAQSVQTSIHSQAARANPTAHNRGVKRAPFVVLIGASMPSILAEIGFLSNLKDETNLGKPEYRQKIAEALYKGLAQYSQSLSHFEDVKQIARTERPAGGKGVQH
jgi:N-acetylmuramoyl-L-alanine amidase